MRNLSVLAAVALCAIGCSSSSSDADDPNIVRGDDQNQTEGATFEFNADHSDRLVGSPVAGKPLTIDYAVERLPQCRGNVGGGGPAWTITGFYSENGAPAKMFDVTKLTADGKDRVAAPGTITPQNGGDLAIWFQVSSGFGCSEYDSQFGQNYHVSVGGVGPRAGASITFGKNGAPVVDGALKAGTKVKVKYEQDRLPACRRTQGGFPQWAISGFSQIDGEDKHAFGTAVAASGDRKEVDAYVDLPHAGKLALWFQVVDVGGCNEYDSNGGANYTFTIEN